MNIPSEVLSVLSRLESNGFEAFVVGGCVRDSLLKKVPADWDICTIALPEEISSIFSDHYVIPTGLKHGTVTVVSHGMNIEITTYRQDGTYLDNRHPETVTFTKTLLEDLRRRDFTINAMAYSPSVGLIDPFHGEYHLKHSILCCMGCPKQRFSEDALRILRAIRFAAVYQLTIEETTAQAIHIFQDNLSSISVERIYAELKKILVAQDASKVLTEYPDILRTVFPDTGQYFSVSSRWSEFIRNFSKLPASFPLRLASLFYWFHNDINYSELCKKVLARLKPDKKTFHHVLSLVQEQKRPLPVTLSDTRRFVGKYGQDFLQELVEWHRIQFGENQILCEGFMHEIREKHLCCTVSDLAISGETLKEHGLSGEEIGATLQSVLNTVIDDNYPNEKKSLLKLLFS